MKKIALLGATGSVGTNTIAVIKAYPQEFQLIALSFYNNVDKGRQLIQEFAPQVVAVGNESIRNQLSAEFPNVHFEVGEKGLIAVATAANAQLVLSAVSGSIGLQPTLAAIEAGKDIALANKETLVMAGAWVMATAKRKGVTILPVDSEHSAIFQCLKGQAPEELQELVITASGGSFRELSRKELATVTLEQALQHPNWSMGPKITIDSSTMVNKGLEVIEAHWLFDVDYDKIKVVLHKESIVHSMIVLEDGAYLAQLGPSDMREPIQYALTYPERWPIKQPKTFDITKVEQLNFEKLDTKRFPMLALAYAVGRKGGAYPTVYNAANEIAVAAFLAGQINYLQIEQLIQRAVDSYQETHSVTLSDVITIDQEIRNTVLQWIKEEGKL